MDWAQIQSNALSGKRLTALSDLSAVLILSLSEFYRPSYRWDVLGEIPSDSEWNDIEHAISEMENEIMKGMIGMLIPHVLGTLTGLEVLLCDGSTYLRVDYPELYEAIHVNYQVDADTFTVPNLRGKFPLGENDDLVLSSEGGSFEETLDIIHMPVHSHSNAPHNHSEIIAVPALADLGTGVPVPSAVVSAGLTGLSAISIDTAGDGQPHNNMPPYSVIAWCIVAR